MCLVWCEIPTHRTPKLHLNIKREKRTKQKIKKRPRGGEGKARFSKRASQWSFYREKTKIKCKKQTK